MKFAFRQLLKDGGFTIIAIVTLALGIGVNTTGFSLAYAMLYRLPPYPDPDRIVEVFATTPQSSQENQSPANVHDELSELSVFEHAAPFAFATSNLARTGEPATRVDGLQVGGDFFAVLGVQPLIGRALTPADDRPGHNDVVVVSEQFWRKNLGASPNALGTVLRLDAKPVTVVGVMPSNFQDIMAWGTIEIWQPLGYGSWTDRTNSWLGIIARLKPDTPLSEARPRLATIAARLAHDFPATNANHGLAALTYKQVRTEGSTLISWIIMGLMFSVLLIACVNLANLQLVRTARRTHEFAVRIALGASRRQLIRQLLSESLVLVLVGGALGLWVAACGNRLLGSRIQMGSDTPGFDLSLDYPVLVFTLLASALTGVVFGLMPARMAWRTDVNASLKQSVRGSTGDRAKHRMRQGLVVAELALALSALSAAGFFVRGIQRLQRVETGWPTGNLVTGRLVLPWNSYTNNDQLRSIAARMDAALAELPGVDHAAISGSIPIFSLSGNSPFRVEGRPPSAKGQEATMFTERVSPDYFPTLGIRLLAGREFTAADRGDSRGVIIINRSMAEKLWPQGNAIGHRIGSLADPAKPDWREVVGIVNDVRFIRSTDAGTPFQTYHPLAQDPDHYLSFTVHSVGPAPALADEARQAITRLDPDLAVYAMSTVDEVIKRSDSNMLLIGELLTVTALLGLFLALVGVYGVVANLAVQRTREIGIRLALGAQNGSVIWLVLRDGAILATCGTTIGILLALGLTRALSAAIPEVPGQDPMLVASLAVLLMAATVLACWLPARRATRISPITALRDE